MEKESMQKNQRRVVGILIMTFMIFGITLIPTPAMGNTMNVSDADIKWTEGIKGGAIYFDKGEGTITGCDITVTEAVIPESIEGTLISAISERAFSDCVNLTKVSIPSGVEKMGHMPFENCENLENIIVSEANDYYSVLDNVLFNKNQTTLIKYSSGNQRNDYLIPNTVTDISAYAFYKSKHLKNVTIPAATYLINQCAFSACSSLENIKVDVENIRFSEENGVLFNADKTQLIQYPAARKDKEYSILSNVKYVWGGAFYSCKYLEKISIPASIINIGDEWGFGEFVGCQSLNTIEVDKANTEFASKDGVLMLKDEGSIICYPANKLNVEYTIFDNVTFIAPFAFKGNKNIVSLTLPETVTEIQNAAFSQCESLEKIIIPSTVVNIVDNAFEKCDAVTIYGKSQSYAETYAANNNIPFVVI
ncbi:MAG: leucine-rich repeat domain-containing protein, partial [Lachnospiraceae bacterium]|nr:leucine-rich repeat domain-containing protein [Lachnospiraceae bacterium]